MTGRVTDRDRGYKKLLKRLTPKPSDVTVGVHEADGAAQHGNDEQTIVEIASYHEFGGPNNNPPRRSFIRDWADENSEKHKAMLKKLAAGVIAGKLESVDQALELFGVRAVGEVQQRIAQGIEPPLKDATIQRKGSSVPLIDTGQLRSSIVHKVNK
jgi:hypothetical protein